VIKEFDEFTKRIPLTFLLGFYVAAVVKRWWEQFEHIAWPDDLLLMLNVIIPPRPPSNLPDFPFTAEQLATKRRAIARFIVFIIQAPIYEGSSQNKVKMKTTF